MESCPLNLSALTANKNTKFMFTKTRWLLFLSMVSLVTIWKNSKQTLLYFKKVTVQKLVIKFWPVTSNHKFNKYWASVNLLFLIKNIIWGGSFQEGL